MKRSILCAAVLVLTAVVTVGLFSCSILFVTPEEQTAASTDAAALTGNGFAGGETAEPTTGMLPARGEDGSLTGQFTSDQSLKLRLLVKYTRVPGDGGTDRLTVTVRLSSFSLSVGERASLGKLRVGNETLTFSTVPMEIAETKTAVLTNLYTHTFTVPHGESVSVSASWHFGGTYAGVEIAELTVAGSVPA